MIPDPEQRFHVAVAVPTTVVGIVLVWYLLLAYHMRDLCFLCRFLEQGRRPIQIKIEPGPPEPVPEPEPVLPKPEVAVQTDPPLKVVLPPLTRNDIALARSISVRTDVSLASGLVYDGKSVYAGQGAATGPAYNSALMLP